MDVFIEPNLRNPEMDALVAKAIPDSTQVTDPQLKFHVLVASGESIFINLDNGSIHLTPLVLRSLANSGKTINALDLSWKTFKNTFLLGMTVDIHSPGIKNKEEANKLIRSMGGCAVAVKQPNADFILAENKRVSPKAITMQYLRDLYHSPVFIDPTKFFNRRVKQRERKYKPKIESLDSRHIDEVFGSFQFSKTPISSQVDSASSRNTFKTGNTDQISSFISSPQFNQDSNSFTTSMQISLGSSSDSPQTPTQKTEDPTPKESPIKKPLPTLPKQSQDPPILPHPSCNDFDLVAYYSSKPRKKTTVVSKPQNPTTKRTFLVID